MPLPSGLGILGKQLRFFYTTKLTLKNSNKRKIAKHIRLF
ncbi:hypothetical protein HJ01_01931 [Flavobacterium frigoris PS1]|uniref:Uncharacterized protein n=1 Tax=Flavobacterium frigoris (strain PS1) TaxID=1086011 RepID=H7FRR9_FLAFP|nr:hypothetical protein HJ01_01931 [Flavobacterium frigoris PS1]